MPRFDFLAPNATEAKQQIREVKETQDAANTVISRCNRLAKEMKERDDPSAQSKVNAAYLDELAVYLTKRKTESWSFLPTTNHQEIKAISAYIDTLVTHVVENRELAVLKEEKIQSLRGLFSQRLHDICVTRKNKVSEYERFPRP